MKIIRAQHLGMCFGVRDAISLAHAKASGGALTVLGELVHNQQVLNDLKRRGVQIAADPQFATTPSAMITAHGASEKAKRRAQSFGLELVDATCPLVTNAHAALQRLLALGCHPVIIGKKDHVEVRGMTEDLDAFDVILCERDLEQLAERPFFGVVSQTTQPIEHVQFLVSRLRQKFPDSRVEFIDTVCRPTKQRQTAAIETAQRSTVVLVIGGANSNNTHQLVATCRKYCDRVHHVQTANDVNPNWLRSDDVVGITAGTSTPDILIDGVEARVREVEASACTQVL